MKHNPRGQEGGGLQNKTCPPTPPPGWKKGIGPLMKRDSRHQHPTHFRLHNSIQSLVAGVRQSRDPWAPGLGPSQSGPTSSGQQHSQATVRAEPLPWAPETAGRGALWPSTPSFSAVKSLLSMAKMGGPNCNPLSLGDTSLLRAGTRLGLMAEAAPWLYVDLSRPTAGRQGRGVGHASCVGADLGAPRSAPDPAVMEFLNKGRTCLLPEPLQIRMAVCVLIS